MIMDAQEQPQVAVRPARPEDRGPVLAFSVNTFSWGDYLEQVWDQWFADPKGQLFVAAADGLPIAVEHVTFVGESEAWLQGLRVDPAFRQKGVGTTLTKETIRFAVDHGAHAVRFFTAVGNTPVERMMVHLGFEPVTKFSRFSAPAEPSAGQTPEAAVLGEIERLWQLITASPYYRLAAGNYCLGWRCRELTKARLAAHLSEGAVSVLREEGGPAAAAIIAPTWQESTLWVASIYGTGQSIRRLANQLRARAASVGAQDVVVLLPPDDDLIAEMAAAKFSTEEEAAREEAASDGFTLYSKEF
ncbi:MAG: GNAT family N-acetyltransferase [Chloroflexota bacterium]